MLKKTNEKEAYLAPQWGMRKVQVERQFLGSNSPLDDNTPEEEEYSDQGQF